jgi:hypothetical protein
MATTVESRYLCSNLVSVHLPVHSGGEREVVGNLEEIYPSGAYLNLEEPIDSGLPIRMVCSDLQATYEFKAVVAACHHDPATGYYIEVEFSPGFQWSPEVYMPKHVIRASSLLAGQSEDPALQHNCCDRGVCPKEVIARILQPESPLTGRVRAVAREVATLCGELTEDEAATCFGSLFGTGRECRLFAEFLEAYAEERRRGPRSRRKGLRAQVQVLVQLAGDFSTEALTSNSCAQEAQRPAKRTTVGK